MVFEIRPHSSFTHFLTKKAKKHLQRSGSVGVIGTKTVRVCGRILGGSLEALFMSFDGVLWVQMIKVSFVFPFPITFARQKAYGLIQGFKPPLCSIKYP